MMLPNNRWREIPGRPHYYELIDFNPPTARPTERISEVLKAMADRKTCRCLVDRIEKRIRAIPANNPGYLSVAQHDLGSLLERDLLRKIAEVAADEALTPISAPLREGEAT